MERTPVFTNLVFVYALLLVLLLVASSVVFYPFDSAGKILATLALPLAGLVVGAFVVAFIQLKVVSKESVWLQPASVRAGTLVVNSVVVLWLCGVAFLAFVILKATESLPARAGMILSLVAGAGLGRYLQRRYWPRSWAGYGIGFLIALVVILVAAVLAKS